MGRTVQDIFVSGRNVQEMRTAVLQWFAQNQFELIENRVEFVKGRWGTGLVTAPKYFQISFKPAQGGVTVHTEGWVAALGDQSFSGSAMMGGIPRREGWHAMERLWAMLKAMSTIARVCPQCGRALNEDVKFCQYCGKQLG